MPAEHAIAIVGIGNALAGDDGAGLEVVKLLQERFANDSRLKFLNLEGDLFEIGDHLGEADRFLFVDAVAGNPAGEIVHCTTMPRAFAPSFHQTDIGAVMRCLLGLKTVDPFPAWEVWGIIVDPPREISRELSAPVAAAVPRLVENLAQIIGDLP